MTPPPFLGSLERLLTDIPQSSTLMFRAFVGCAAFMALVAARLVRGSPRRR